MSKTLSAKYKEEKEEKQQYLRYRLPCYPGISSNIINATHFNMPP